MERFFNNNQAVKVESFEQWQKIKHLVRSGEPCPPLPCYLEYSESVTRGLSLGVNYTGLNTWSREPLEILEFDYLESQIIELNDFPYDDDH